MYEKRDSGKDNGRYKEITEETPRVTRLERNFQHLKYILKK